MAMWAWDNEFLGKEILNIHQRIVLKARNYNEWELDNIKSRMSPDIVLINIVLRTITNPSEELPVLCN